MENQEPVTLTREALFKMVWQEPASKIAERYKIPYTDFKKICDSTAVPIPGSGYWSKLRAGKPVPVAILPVDYTGPKVVKIEAREPAKRAKHSEVISDIKLGYKKLLKVPAKLTEPDKLIIVAKEQLEKDKYLRDGLAWSGSGILISMFHLKISREHYALWMRL